MIGWLLVFLATTTTMILISECFLGFGGNSLLIVSFSSITEMTDPRYRNSFIIVYGTLQALGMSSAGVLGQYLTWKFVSLVYLTPVIVTFLNALFMWPESPAWLALKEKFDECERTFRWLRGNGLEAENELMELKLARKKSKDKLSCSIIRRRDFYLPIFLMFVLMNLSYWIGQTVVMIYSRDILRRTTGNDVTATNGMITIDVLLFISEGICAILARKFNNKTIVLITTCGSILAMMFCCVVTYTQSLSVLGPSDLCLYGLAAFIIFCNIGMTPIVFAMALEIVPVKHRGIGGMMYMIFLCCLHTSSLKAAPYMFEAIDLWGTFLIYIINGITCMTIVWIYVPETKNRTLQELEEYFVNGNFVKRVKIDAEMPIMKNEASK